MNIPSSAPTSAGTTGYAAFFALRDAAARRMEAAAPPRTAARTGADPIPGSSNISLTKPARAVDPLQAASSSRVPLKGGRIDCLA